MTRRDLRFAAEIDGVKKVLLALDNGRFCSSDSKKQYCS